MRMSESNFDVPEAPGLTPSFAMKFLRDGMRSVNMLTLANESFGPMDNFNFFSEDFYTRVFLPEEDCPKRTIVRKFLEVTDTIQSLGNAEMARFNVDGSRVNGQVKFPFDLEFEPMPEITERFSMDREFDANGNEIKFYD